MSKGNSRTAVPQLRFPEFAKSSGWTEVPLSKVCEVNPSSEDLPNTFTYIDLESVDSGRLLQKKTILKADAPSRAQRLLKSGDIIYQMVRPYQKNNLFFNEDDCSAYVASTGYAQLRAFESNSYLFQYLHSDQFVSKVLAKCTGSSYPAINSTDLSNIPVVIPKKDEQQKVADCLSSLDDLITFQGDKVDALKNYKKGLLQQLFPQDGESTPRLRFPRLNESGEWTLEKLGGKTLKIGSGITPKGGSENYKTNGRPFVRSQNVGWGQLILDDVVYIDDQIHSTFSSTEIQQSDVLLNITGASIGRSAISNERVTGGNVNQHVCIIRTNAEELYPLYLCQYILSPLGQNQIDSFQAGGNREGLNFAQIRSFNIPFPPTLHEQKRIADCLSSIDELIIAEINKIETLKADKRGLLQLLIPSIKADEND
jgi:type I restriction enzyme S subunit